VQVGLDIRAVEQVTIRVFLNDDSRKRATPYYSEQLLKGNKRSLLNPLLNLLGEWKKGR